MFGVIRNALFKRKIGGVEMKGIGPLVPRTLGEMLAYFEIEGFEAKKEYNSLLKEYVFSITKAGYTVSSRFVYPEKDGVDKGPIMQHFCDELIAYFYNTHSYTKNGAPHMRPTIEKVIFNDPATIVFWSDKTKTVVKTHNGEKFDPEKGLAMAMAKRAFGNQGNYFNHIKKWVDKYNEEHPAVETETLYFDDKPVVTATATVKTYPIRNDENCMKCRWGWNRDCAKFNCDDCPHIIDNALRSCKCSSVKVGDPCPHFEKSENT